MTPPTERDLGATIRSRLATAMAEADPARLRGVNLLPQGTQLDLSSFIAHLGPGCDGLGYVYWCLRQLSEELDREQALLVLDQPDLGRQIFSVGHRPIEEILASPEARVPGLHLGARSLPAQDSSSIVNLCRSALALALYRHDAARDPLSELLNRRSFGEEFRRYMANARRYGYWFSLALLDVDRLKQINDEHGHAKGDEVIRVTGRELRRLMRAGEVAARMGGDEFALLLLGEERTSADRIRNMLEKAVLGHTGLAVRYSVGLAHSSEVAIDPAALYRLADSRLYEEKRTRRHNGGSLDDPPEPAPPEGAPAEAGTSPSQETVEPDQDMLHEHLHRWELELRRYPGVFWAQVSSGAAGTLDVKLAVSGEEAGLRDRVTRHLEAEGRQSVQLSILHWPTETTPEHRHHPRHRVKLERVRSRPHYESGGGPAGGTEVELSLQGRRGLGFSGPYGGRNAVHATISALMDLGLSVPYDVEAVSQLDLTARRPVLVVLRRRGSEESRFGLVQAASLEEAAVRALLDALNRELEAQTPLPELASVEE